MRSEEGDRTDRAERTNRTMNEEPRTKNVGLTSAQLKKIWAVARELNWDSARLHRYVGICFAVESLKLLTRENAKRLIDDLERYVRKGARGEGRGTRGGDGRGYREYGAGVDQDGKMVSYATPAQVACLRAEAGRMNWGDIWILQVATRKLGRPVWDLGALHGDEAARMINVIRGYVDGRLATKARRHETGAEA